MGATVTVGCKLPHGLFLDMGDKRVTIKGVNSTSIIGGHGITENVDKEFFDAWMAKNANLTFVKAGFIFAHEKANNAAAEAKDREANATGLEALNPDAMPKGLEKADKPGEA